MCFIKEKSNLNLEAIADFKNYSNNLAKTI